MRTRTFRKLASTAISILLSGSYICAPKASVTQPMNWSSNALESNDPTMQEVADGTLSFIQGRTKSINAVSLKAPQRMCLRGVKKGLSIGGVFNRYPAWKTAADMTRILNNQKQMKRYVRPYFSFTQLKHVNAQTAPAYSILVYGGSSSGHIELKVPASLLIEKGFSFALESEHGKIRKIPLRDLQYVYISDYIDAFPRNHPNSRTANNLPNNQRPLKAVFQLTKSDFNAVAGL